MTRKLDAPRSPFELFGSELRRVRQAVPMSLAELGQKMSFSGDMVGKVETCERAPTPKFAEACDTVFPHLDGHFMRLLAYARRSGGSPAWFRNWLQIEQEAISLRTWQPLVIPGLLQTADYARAIFAASPDATDDELDELVAARMERQGILDRPKPQLLWVVLAESVLFRCVGSPKIMHDQLEHLAEMSCRRNITVQVVPDEISVHAGLSGAFIIAGLDGAESILYQEGIEGQIIDRRGVIELAALRFDALRAQALPEGASRDLIRKVAEERWTET